MTSALALQLRLLHGPPGGGLVERSPIQVSSDAARQHVLAACRRDAELARQARQLVLAPVSALQLGASEVRREVRSPTWLRFQRLQAAAAGVHRADGIGCVVRWPVPRSSSFDQSLVAFEAQAELVQQALAAADNSAPSRCAGWTVADLDRHLGAVTGGLADLLQQPVGRPADGDLASWAAALPQLADDLDAEAHSTGPGFAEGATRLTAALQTADRDDVVEQRTGRQTVRDALLFRVIELVAHGRDLPTPVEPDRQALKLVVRALAGLLATRAPGHHVECRIPPYAAVQCVAGPRHTRGTPPNVVEAQPVTFVELCTGRLSWADAAKDGRVRTWGDRADLSPWLPLLR